MAAPIAIASPTRTRIFWLVVNPSGFGIGCGGLCDPSWFGSVILFTYGFVAVYDATGAVDIS